MMNNSSLGGCNSGSRDIANEIVSRFRDFGECTLSLNGYEPRKYVILERYILCKHELERAEYHGLSIEFIYSSKHGGNIMFISQILSIEYQGQIADTFTAKRGMIKIGLAK